MIALLGDNQSPFISVFNTIIIQLLNFLDIQKQISCAKLPIVSNKD